MKLFVVCFVLFFINLVHAETGYTEKKKMLILVPEIEGWTGEGAADKNHHFLSYLDNGSNVDQFEIEIQKVPPARAIALFNRMDTGCLLGADPLTLSLYVDHKLQFFKIMESRFYAMALKESELNTISDSTSLAVIRGFDAKSHIPTLKDQIIAEYNDVAQAIKMLERNRVDAFLYWDIIPDELLSKLKKVEETPLRTDEVGLNCIDSPSGAQLVTHLTRNYPNPNLISSRIVQSNDDVYLGQ